LSRTFSIIGAVQNPGQYAIPRNDFRLLDALVSARDLTVDTDVRGTRGIENILVLRKIRPEMVPSTQPAGMMPRPGTAPAGPPDLLAPRAPTTQPASKQMLMLQTAGTAANEPSATGPTTRPSTGAAANAAEGEGRYIIGPDGKPQYVGGESAANRPAPTTAPAAAPGENEGRYIIGPDGKPQYVGGPEPVPMPGPDMGAMRAVPPGATTKSFVFNDLRSPLDTRIIRVPVAALRQGDLRYNLVIRPDDLIIVRPPVIGEYYMGGHVARTGVYSLSGRKISLTQAVISAGMLDQLAVPGRSELRRRIGSDHVVIVRVNLEKIFA